MRRAGYLACILVLFAGDDRRGCAEAARGGAHLSNAGNRQHATAPAENRGRELDARTALGGRWGIWEAESRRLGPDDVIRMRRAYGVGVFFYRDATAAELRQYKRLGMLNVVVAHALYRPWKDHAFLEDPAAVRAWVARAVRPPDVDGLAYDCESRIERTHALEVIRVMADEVKRAGKLFIVCPHFNIGDKRFALGPDD